MTNTDTQTTKSGSPPKEVRQIAYRWVAMFVLLIGTFMVVLDTTVVNLGLPSIQDQYNVEKGIEWVVTAYLAAVGVAQACSGWLADKYGRRAMFIVSMVIFTAASLMCALAFSFEALVAARVIQGIGGGMMMPIAMAMIYELFAPHERGKALGYFGIAIMAAPAIGPVFGGGLVESLSWRWLFLINIPIGVIGVPIALKLLRDTGFRESRPFDRTGLFLGGTGLVLALVGISEGGIAGWTEPFVIAMIGTGVLLLAAFVWHVNRTEWPLIEIKIMSNKVFALGMLSVGLMAVAQFSRLVYIPLELGNVRAVPELKIGLVMLPSALGVAVTMPIGGRLVDRIGAKLPVMFGASVLGLSFFGLSQLTVETPLVTIAAILFVGGLGSGLAMMAPNIVAMNSVSARRVSQASGLSSITRQVAAAVGVAAMSSVFVSAKADVTASEPLVAYRTVFYVTIGILAAAVAVAFFMPGKRAALALQEERRIEQEELGVDFADAHPTEVL